jgi:alpha-glucosidase (family GH31 glycosyl hydrolase)
VGFWVGGASGEAEPIRWWQGQGYSLDVTNEKAVEWYLDRLYLLQEKYGIDGFKFDAGEPCFLPPHFRTRHPISPNNYTTLWVEKIASRFQWGEVRSAYRNQNAPIFVREWDRFSSWGLDMGLLGYPFVLPDMVGGNAYGSLLPDKELLIRWAQANALLPAMQFSVAPWDFDEETTDLCRQAVRWHTTNPHIYPLAEAATKTGYPIIRPVSWLAPDDPATYPIGDQFALGETTMVAPVMEAGARTRDFYLPTGTWCDVLRGTTLTGGKWVRDYPAPLDYLPWFERTEELHSA